MHFELYLLQHKEQHTHNFHQPKKIRLHMNNVITLHPQLYWVIALTVTSTLLGTVSPSGMLNKNVLQIY